MVGRLAPMAVVRPRVAPVVQSDNSNSAEKIFNKCWDALISGETLTCQSQSETIESVWGRIIEV